jgi:ribosomal subunit interface protein
MLDIKIKATGIDLPQTIVNYVYDKIGSLGKFWQKLESKDVVKVLVEIARTTKHHKKGIVYRAECSINLPGKVLRAEREDWNLRVAIDAIKNELQEQIKKYNSKIRPQDSGGQELIRKLKEK